MSKDEQCEACGSLVATLWTSGRESICVFCITERNEKREVFTLDPESNEILEVVVTDEGVIMDCFNKDEHLGTIAMMADEWFAFVIANDPMNRSLK